MRLTLPLAIACAAVAFALSIHTGRIGFMPLDQSLAFDGGWRLLNGQVPWRDFMTPDGLVPIGLQTAFFALLGVNWWSYVVHAALINAAAAFLVFCYLRAAGLPVAPSLSCALATGVWLYPQVGTPYKDQHSLFFAGVAVAGCCHAARTGRRGWWLAAGISAGLAILSKQIPALVMLPVAGVALIAAPRRQAVAGLSLTVAASLATVAVILGAVFAAGARFSDFLEFAWRLPSEIGQTRMSRASEHIESVISRLIDAMHLTYWGVIGFAVVTLAVLWIRQRRREQLTVAGSEVFTLLMASAGIVATTVVSCALTQNDYEMLAGLLPLAAALLLLACLRSIGSDSAPTTWWARRVAVTIFCVTMLADAAVGYQTFALSRVSNDFDVADVDRTRETPARLRRSGWSEWILPPHYVSAGDSFDTLLEWLAQHPGNIFLAGDESILYGLAGRPSVAPLLWDHPGLTFRRDPAGISRVAQLLDTAMTRYAVRWVVLPANGGWVSRSHQYGPYKSFLAAYDGQACEAVGTYRVCEVASPTGAQP